MGIDNDDKKIIEMIEKYPNITYRKIAKRIKKSQPAVGARIIKLERKNLLYKRVGFNIKKVDLQLAIVQVSTIDVDQIIKRIEKSPFINYVFKTTGEYNLFCFVAATDLETIDKIVNLCFRKDPNVSNVKMDILMESMHDFIVPIYFKIEHLNKDKSKGTLNIDLSKIRGSGSS